MTDYDAASRALHDRIIRDPGWEMLSAARQQVRDAYDLLLARLTLAVGDGPLFLVSSTSTLGDFSFDGRLVVATPSLLVKAGMSHSERALSPSVSVSVKPLRVSTFDLDTTKRASTDSAWPGHLRLTLHDSDGTATTLPLGTAPASAEYIETLGLLEHLRTRLK